MRTAATKIVNTEPIIDAATETDVLHDIFMDELHDMFIDPTDEVSIVELAEELSRVKQIESDRKSDYEMMRNRRVEMEEQLYEAMLNAGFKNIRTESGTFSPRIDTYYSCPKESQDTFFTWLRAKGLGDLIQPTVNSRTLTATMKDLEAEGGEIPVYLQKSQRKAVSLRRA